MSVIHGVRARGFAVPVQRGSTLIEVLVAIFVTSLGILALVGLTGTAARFSKTSETRSISTLLANDLADRMRANLSGITSYSATPTTLATALPTEVTCVSATACTASELAAKDLAEWQAALYGSLPSGTGYVSLSDATNRMFDVWIIWNEPQALDASFVANSKTVSTADASGCPPSFTTTTSPRCMFFRIGL